MKLKKLKVLFGKFLKFEEQRFHKTKDDYLSIMGFCGTHQTKVEPFSRGFRKFS